MTPYDLKVEQVEFADIGHALAQKIRFNGQCTVMGYTVAQHCVLGALELAKLPGPDGGKVDGRSKLALAFLLHEVSEVYLPDVPSPIKRLLHVEIDAGSSSMVPTISWTCLEGRHADVILQAIGLSSIRHVLDCAIVHETDLRMLMTEKRDLMGPSPQEWGFTEQPYPAKIVDIWEPAYAEDKWNAMFAALKRRSGL